MPPPSPHIEEAWARAIKESPDLRDQWGEKFPVNESGNVVIAALFALDNHMRARTPTPTAAPTPQVTGRDSYSPIVPVPAGPERPSIPLTIPKDEWDLPPISYEVDWGQRARDIAGIVPAIQALPFSLTGARGLTEAIPNPFRRFLPGKEPEEAPPPPDDPGLLQAMLGGAREAFDPIFKGLGAIEEIAGPARGMAFGGWVPGLTKPGVQARSKAARERGEGPFMAAQIGYEESVEAGEIPWLQRFGVEALTSPIELLPYVGMAGFFGKQAMRLAGAGTKMLGTKVAREAAEEVIPAAARKVAEEVPLVEQAAKRAETMARGPRAKIAILEEEHRRALEAIDNIETKIPLAQKRLEMPIVQAGEEVPAVVRVGDGVPTVGLTPDEVTKLARLKGQLANQEAALEDLLSDPEALRYGRKPRPYSVRYPGRTPGSEGYRPPTKPGYTEAERLISITDAEDAVRVAEGGVATAKKAVDEAIEYLDQNQAQLSKQGDSGADEIASLKEDIAEARSNHAAEKDALSDARGELKDAKKPTAYTAEEKAYIAAADKLDVEYPASLRASIQRAQQEIAGLEARQATPPVIQEAVEEFPTAAQVGEGMADRASRNEAEFFLETVDDQLATARSIEKSARISLQDAQAQVRGRMAKEALAQRDAEISREMLPTAVREVAGEVAEEVPSVTPVADVAVTPATRRASIDDIISRVPETSVNTTTQGKRSAVAIVRRNFDELLSGDEVEGRAAKVAYIARQTGRSEDEIEAIIRMGTEEVAEAAIGPGRMFTSASVDELRTTHVIPNFLRKVGETLAGRGSRRQGVIGRTFTPAALMGIPGLEAKAEGVLYRLLQESQTAATNGRLQRFATTEVSGILGRPTRLFDVATEGTDKGRLLLLDGTRVAFGDVAQNPTAFLNRGQINEAQHRWITDAYKYVDELARNYQLVSGKKLIAEWANVEHYWPRFAQDADGNIKIGQERIFARQSPGGKRIHETVEDGMKAGVDYLADPFKQLEQYATGLNKMVRDTIFEERLLTQKMTLPDGTMMSMAVREKPRKVPDWQSQRRWGELDITPEAQRQLAQPMGLRGGKILSGAETVAAVPKLIVAGLFDTGMFLIQGLPLFFNSPGTWGKTVLGSLRTLFSRSPEDYFHQWMRTGYARKIQDAAEHGMDVSAVSEYYQIGQRGLGFLGRLPVLGKPLEAVGGRFGAAFHAYMNVGRVEIYDAMSQVARSTIRDPVELAREQRRIAKIADTIMGGTSTKGLGLASTERQVENAFLFFAPRYTRAVFATVAHAAGSGVGASETRKILAKMMFGASAIIAGATGAIGAAQGKSKGEIFEDITHALDPRRGAQFMSVKYGDQYYGLGGGYRALAKLMAEANPLIPGVEGQPNSWGRVMQNLAGGGGKLERGREAVLDNPFVSFWRSKAAIPTGTFADILEGEDPVGRDFSLSTFAEDPRRLASALFKKVSPFPIQAFIEAMGSGAGIGTAVRAGALEFVGGRQFPVSRGRRAEELEDEMVTNTFGDGEHRLQQPEEALKVGRKPGEIYTKASEIEDLDDTLVMEAAYKNDPANKSLKEKLDRLWAEDPRETKVDDFYSEITRIQEVRNDQQKDFISRTMPRFLDPSAQKPNDPYAFRQALKRSSREYTVGRDSTERSFEILETGVDYARWQRGREPDRIEEPQEWTIHRWYQIRDENRDIQGNIDYVKFDEAWKAEQDGWGEDSGLVELFEQYQSEQMEGTSEKVVRDYYKASGVIADADYWRTDFPKTTDALRRQYPNINVDELWATYISSDSADQKLLRESRDPQTRTIIRLLSSTREKHRANIRRADPNVDRAVVTWYRSKPLHPQNRRLWQVLYE